VFQRFEGPRILEGEQEDSGEHGDERGGMDSLGFGDVQAVESWRRRSV